MIIFVGPYSAPITGQSMAFDVISSHYNGTKKILFYGKNSRNKIAVFWGTFTVFFQFIYLLFTKRGIKTLYITTSRTILGFCRDMLFILSAKLFFIKVVNHLHGADFKDFRSDMSPFLRKCIDFVYNKIDTSIVLLPGMKDQYALYKAMNVVSISNCALPLSHLPKNNSDGLNVLYLSNIMYSKGILLLISAVDNIVELGVKVKLSIAGSPMGDEYKNTDEIQSIFNKMIVNKSYIEYFGAVTGREKEQLLIDSDVFVLPSFYKSEAQPISIIEAMFSGSAIITTKHNYLSSMVSSKNGFSVTPHSIEAIESPLLELSTNSLKLKELCDYNKNYALEHYSLDRYVDEVSAVIDDTIGTDHLG